MKKYGRTLFIRKIQGMPCCFVKIVVAIFICSLIVACSEKNSGEAAKVKNSSLAASNKNISGNQPQTPIPTPTPISPIRLVRFDKVAYPNYPEYIDYGKKKLVTLKPGETSPSYINYGDVTGDGQEEAMIVLSIESSGSEILHRVYIFTLEKEKLKLLWDFDTGDRSEGGIRQVYAEGGKLAIELFGENNIVGQEFHEGDGGLAASSRFTKTRYKWDGKTFRQEGEATVLPNPAKNAAPVMPDYQPVS